MLLKVTHKWMPFTIIFLKAYFECLNHDHFIGILRESSFDFHHGSSLIMSNELAVCFNNW